MLKRPRFMMLLPAVDGVLQRLQIRWTNGETSVAALPRESCEAGRLGLHPFGRCRFQFLHQVREGDGARQPDGEMNMIRHAADAIGSAIRVACDRGQIGVDFRTRVGNQKGTASPRAEDDVDDDEAQ